MVETPATVEPEPADVTQADIAGYILPDLTVVVGSTVRWTNLDSAGHTATAGRSGIYDGTGWDSRGLEQNESFSWEFSQERVFPYTCRFHPSMNATVTVVAAGTGSAEAGDSPQNTGYVETVY